MSNRRMDLDGGALRARWESEAARGLPQAILEDRVELVAAGRYQQLFTGRVLASIEVPGDPVPKARPRIGAGGGRTTDRTRAQEELFGWAFKRAIRRPFDGQLSLVVRFHTATRRRVDADNLAKLVMDAGNGIAWHDDAQIRQVLAVVRLAAPVARTLVAIAAHTTCRECGCSDFDPCDEGCAWSLTERELCTACEVMPA